MEFESYLIPCSFELASGWTAADVRADEEYPFVAITPSLGDALLRLTTFDPQAARMDAAQWVELAASVHRPRGRPVVAETCGDFSGYQTEFTAGEGRWLRGWVLRAGPIALDITYTCALSDAGRDDAAVDAMLATLRLRNFNAR